MKLLFVFVLLIVIFACSKVQPIVQDNKTIEKDEFSELKNLVLINDWNIIEEETSNNEIKNFKIQIKINCTKEIRKKPNPNLFNETIMPFIRIIFETRWTKEYFDKEKEQRDKCIEQITKHPEKATGCPNLAPHINTEKYSIFIYSDDCNDESLQLKEKIINLLKTSS